MTGAERTGGRAGGDAGDARTPRQRSGRRLTYRVLETEPSYEHPVDRVVHRRVRRRDLQRIASNAATAIVKALGPRQRHHWFSFERAADQCRARREAACFDVGVEHGIAACAAHGFGTPTKKVRALADHLVRDLLATGAPKTDAVRAAITAAWALVAIRGTEATHPPRPRARPG